MNRRMRAVAIGAITAAAAIGVGAFGAAMASAHASVVTGTSTCQSDGTYTVTWKVANDYTRAEEASYFASTGGGTFSGLPAHIDASPTLNNPQTYKFVTVTQSGIPGTTTSASLTVEGHWSDGYPTSQQPPQRDTGTVSLSGTCNTATPVAPAVTVKTECGVKDTFTAGPTTGVIYTPTTGSLNAGNNVDVVTATPAPGFHFSGNSQTIKFSLVGSPIEPCSTTVTPVAPSVTTSTTCGVADSFTAGPTTGVVYTPPSGTLAEGVVTNVVATPDAGYVFDGAQSVTFPLTGGSIEACAEETTTTTAATTTTVAQVSVDAPAPTTTVVAVAPPAPEAPPLGLPETGSSNTLELLFGGLALIAGAAMLAAVRRRGTAT